MAGAHELVSYGSSKNYLLKRVLFGPVGYIVEFSNCSGKKFTDMAVLIFESS